MVEPLVLLPGMMCDARLFGPQIAELSSEMPIMVAPVTQGERVEEIASSLLEMLPQRFALLGSDLGAVVAMEILRRAENRVSRIALMGANPLAETPVMAANREPEIVKARSGRMAEVMSTALSPDHLAPSSQRMEVMALVADMAEVLGADVFIRQSRAMQRRRDQQAVLRKCKVPALVLCGVHDALCPVKRHSFMAELIPSAKLTVLENSGHYPMLEQPMETTAALREWMGLPVILR
jgi:pimeloyl-ACP methyl ester carboxylesterase